MQSRADRIREALHSSLGPMVLGVENESHAHTTKPGAETHFKVLVVSRSFLNKSRVERQRDVNALLSYEFERGLHALSIRALTPEEYEKGAGEGFVSPTCLGGSKAG